jgi:heme/copper-type cytochrome/quinol oxidase subunit 2
VYGAAVGAKWCRQPQQHDEKKIWFCLNAIYAIVSIIFIFLIYLGKNVIIVFSFTTSKKEWMLRDDNDDM